MMQIRVVSLKWLTCPLGLFLLIVGAARGQNRSDLQALGLEYELRQIQDPRPNRVHVLRITLSEGRLRPAVVIGADPDGAGPAEAELTHPLKLADERSVVAFINSNPWDGLPDRDGKKNRNWYEGQPVDIYGLAVAKGQERSPAVPGDASVWIEEEGRVRLGEARKQPPATEGICGFQQILGSGILRVPEGGPQHPRTAIGVDSTGELVWLVVVDGRQPGYSEGMTLHELGCVMRDLGCWDATNLDGGGSSVMALAGSDGQLRVVNSPSGRAINGRPILRPVPVILTVQRMSATP